MLEAIASLLALILFAWKKIEDGKKKTLGERQEDARRQFDDYLANGEYDKAALVGSDALDRIDAFLRSKGKDTSGGS